MLSSISSSDNRRPKVQLGLLAVFFLVFLVTGTFLHLITPLSSRAQDHYLGGVFDHRQALKKTANGQPRVLLLGGSSLGFSVSARDLSSLLNTNVINLGINANFGYKHIWDLYRADTNPETDLIVLSPEYGLLHTNSAYPKTLCDFVYLNKSVAGLIQYPGCLAGVLSMFADDIRYLVKPSKMTGVYRRSAFTEFGDIESHLDQKGRDVDFNLARDFTTLRAEQLDAYMSFVQDEIISKGYKVQVIPTIVPVSTCADDVQIIEKVYARLSQLNTQKSKFPEPVYCFPDELFFDTPYHMNQRGRLNKTAIFAEYLQGIVKSESSK